MSLTSLSGAAKDDLVVSLAALICTDSAVDVSADNLQAIIEASGNKVAPYWTALFATFAEKTGSFDALLAGPGAAVAAGAAPAAGAAAPAAAAAAPAKKEEVVEEVDLGGGMDMFGGGGEGGSY